MLYQLSYTPSVTRRQGGPTLKWRSAPFIAGAGSFSRGAPWRKGGIRCRARAVRQASDTHPEPAMSQDRPRYNRDEDLKPGRPPRPATEPPGAKESSRSAKTLTDPGSGEPVGHPPAPAQSS